MTSIFNKWSIHNCLKPEFKSKIRMVLVYGDLRQCCLIVTKDRLVYAIGRYFEHSYQSDPKRIDVLCGKDIKTIAHGNGPHALVLTKTGEVYSWKSDKSYPWTVPNIVQIPGDKNKFVVDIACGHSHSMALTNDGMVYAWGMCEYGQTGNGMISVNLTSHSDPRPVILEEKHPTKFHFIRHIRHISCGANHSVAVSCNGQVYAWGINLRGQLGLNDTGDHYYMAREVKNLTGIIIEKVVCGRTHTLALSNEGMLYSWGDNSFGQLGVNLHTGDYSSTPLVITKLKKVLDMAASNSSDVSVALGMEQQIFMWGKCLGRSITLPTFISVDSIHDAFAIYASPSGMHQPFVISDEETEEENDVKINETMSIMDQLMAVFDDKDTSDLTIEVQGKPIYVHKAILKIRSEYFKGMFQGDWKENNDSVIRECNFSYAAYRAFLKFLYTGKIDIPADNSVELLQLADFCNDDYLKASCQDVLVGDISKGNVAFLYSVAVQYNAMVLKKRCIKFAVRHMSDVIKSTSFSELTHEMMKDFITEANEHGVFKM